MGGVMDVEGNSQSLAESPCIGVCSATQWGDAICKGCGRTSTEIRDWAVLPSVYKKLVVIRAIGEGYTPRQVQRYTPDNALKKSSVRVK